MIFRGYVGFAIAISTLALPALGAAAPASRPAPAGRHLQNVKQRKVGLGPVVQSAFGGAIFGWDINQNGSDGLLTETAFEPSGKFLNGIETFDEPSGKITKIVRKVLTEPSGAEPVVDAIAGNDVGLIDDERDVVRSGQIIRHDRFYEMNPVSGNKITGSWKPPNVVGLRPDFVTNNQASSSQAMIAFKRGKGGIERPELYTYDVARDTWGKPFLFPQNQVLAGYLLYTAVDVMSNSVVTGYQAYPYIPDEAPSFDVFDASSGKLVRTFQGLGMGFINGMAIDSTTDIMCTTTQDMSVEFYKVSSGKGFAVQIPVHYGGGALTNGAAVAVDQVHHLFLVAQLNSTFSPLGGSTVIVYDERGDIIEAINGFNFLDRFSVVVVHLAVNPAGRLGYVNGPSASELQSFTY